MTVAPAPNEVRRRAMRPSPRGHGLDEMLEHDTQLRRACGGLAGHFNALRLALRVLAAARDAREALDWLECVEKNAERCAECAEQIERLGRS